MTRKILLPAAVAALVAVGFVTGQVLAPAPVASAQAGGGGPPKALPRPYDVLVTMKNASTTAPGLEKVTCALASTFDVDKIGDHTFLRLSNQAGKLWYFPLENVQMVEAIPIGGGATPAPGAPGGK